VKKIKKSQRPPRLCGKFSFFRHQKNYGIS
jgi:hypothetical protein